MDDSRQFSNDERGTECICGKSKGTRNFFCFDCYDRLPDTFAIGLYRPGELGRKTYEMCVEYLNRRERGVDYALDGMTIIL